MSRWYKQEYLSSTKRLYQAPFSSVQNKLPLPALDAETVDPSLSFGELLLQGDPAAWNWLVEEKDTAYFEKMGVSQGDEDYDDDDHTRFEAMWDFCRYLDARSHNKDQLQTFLIKALYCLFRFCPDATSSQPSTNSITGSTLSHADGVIG